MNQKTLQKADDLFISRDYKSALYFYGNALNENPSNQDAQIGLLLTDMAMNGDEDKAQTLFDYYTIIKDQDESIAYEAINEVMHTPDGDEQPPREILDGITYQDLEEIIASTPDDKKKEIFNNVLFSTKLIIAKKEEFMNFILLLMRYEFDHMILSYLETFIVTFSDKGSSIEVSSMLSSQKSL